MHNIEKSYKSKRIVALFKSQKHNLRLTYKSDDIISTVRFKIGGTI